MLIQGDIKYGPKLPIGKNVTMVQTYLSSAIDDHSRFILASEFYDNQEERIVEDPSEKPSCSTDILTNATLIMAHSTLQSSLNSRLPGFRYKSHLHL